MVKVTDFLFGGLPNMAKKASKSHGGFGEWLFGKEASTEQKSFQTPQQQQLFNQLLGGLGGQGGGGNQALQYLQQYLNPNQQEGFQQFAQPYQQQFERNILPRILQPWGAGAEGGALSSSGFAQALGGASSDFMNQLEQQYSQRGMQSSQTLLSLLQNLLGQQTFGFQQNQASPGLFGSAINAFAGGVGKGFGGFG
jgi:hypothetical protein